MYLLYCFDFFINFSRPMLPVRIAKCQTQFTVMEVGGWALYTTLFNQRFYRICLYKVFRLDIAICDTKFLFWLFPWGFQFKFCNHLLLNRFPLLAKVTNICCVKFNTFKNGKADWNYLSWCIDFIWCSFAFCFYFSAFSIYQTLHDITAFLICIVSFLSTRFLQTIDATFECFFK